MRRAVILGATLALTVGACATSSPRETALGLDSTDRKWSSRECVAARKAAAQFDENKEGHAAIKVVGNLIVPLAGSATSYAMNRMRDDERAELNRRLTAACVSAR